MEQKPDWWDWIELDKPVSEPIRLKEDAPEEVKKKFKEWQERKAKDREKNVYK